MYRLVAFNIRTWNTEMYLAMPGWDDPKSSDSRAHFEKFRNVIWKNMVKAIKKIASDFDLDYSLCQGDSYDLCFIFEQKDCSKQNITEGLRLRLKAEVQKLGRLLNEVSYFPTFYRKGCLMQYQANVHWWYRNCVFLDSFYGIRHKKLGSTKYTKYLADSVEVWDAVGRVDRYH